MNDQQTLQMMRSLRLTGMADRFEAVINLPSHQKPASDVLLAQLVESEELHRDHRKTTNAIKAAHFRYIASLHEVHCTTERNLSKDLIISLADCAYIDRGENIIITGATGCGKSFIASALSLIHI